NIRVKTSKDSPASSDPINQALSSHATTMDRHEKMLHTLSENQQTVSQQLTQLQAMLQTLADPSRLPSASAAPPTPQPSPTGPSPAVHEARIPNPDPYSGTADHCRGFLLQCTLVFTQQSATYSSDGAKTAFVVGLLRGRALEWAESFLYAHRTNPLPFQVFLDHFKQVFETPEKHPDSSRKLFALRQDKRSVADYSVDFRILATEAGWDGKALQEVFYNGLAEQIKD
uniref:Retrotransposon gag domain-containing protein n=1 Tax=Oryzias melastigma TaxID=30732 RepID=A0A3B3C1P6_ORYME